MKLLIKKLASTGFAVSQLVGAAALAGAGSPHSLQIGPITVQEKTRERGLWEPLLGMFVHTCAAADVNGDGWLDLYVGGFYQQLPREKFFRFGDLDLLISHYYPYEYVNDSSASISMKDRMPAADRAFAT